jgi:type IV pilus assembly protein PilO
MALGLPKDPAQQKRVLIAIAPLLVLFLYYYFLHGKKTEEIAAKTTRLEALEAANGPARALASQGGPELQKKLALYEQHIVRLEQLIPEQEEVPDLLHSMTLRAADAEVELSTMRPESEEPGQFYTRQTYSMGVTGSFHRIGQFLSAVGSLPRIITPIDMVLTVKGKPDRHGDMTLDAVFRIETYVIPPPSGAPPAAAAPAPPAEGAP